MFLALLASAGLSRAAEDRLIPLNALGSTKYQGFAGGLYADGRDEPFGSYAEALRKMCTAVEPLDAEGRPSATGKVGLIGLGASVSKQIFDVLEQTGAAEGKRPEMVIVSCAKGGYDVNKISDPARGYWRDARAAVTKAGLTPEQVQVAWYQSDDLRDTRDDFPGRSQRLQAAIAQNMREAREAFPNLRLCYHSARHTTAFMPAGSDVKHGEPRPYEAGWAVKWLLEEQAAGKAELQYDGPHPAAPLMAWATYFWTNGAERRMDGYEWSAAMNVQDGIHLSDAGKQRVVGELLGFWRTDQFARLWFTGPAKNASSAVTSLGASQPEGSAHRASAEKTLKPQQIAAHSLKPGEPALLINGKSKFAKLERLLAPKEPVRMVVWDLQGTELLNFEDVFHRRTELDQLLPAGQYRIHFLGTDGKRLPMTFEVPEILTLR